MLKAIEELERAVDRLLTLGADSRTQGRPGPDAGRVPSVQGEPGPSTGTEGDRERREAAELIRRAIKRLRSL